MKNVEISKLHNHIKERFKNKTKIKELTEHLKEHKKDFSSRRGLLKKVGERRKLLKYLAREDKKAHEDLLERLKL